MEKKGKWTMWLICLLIALSAVVEPALSATRRKPQKAKTTRLKSQTSKPRKGSRSKNVKTSARAKTNTSRNRKSSRGRISRDLRIDYAERREELRRLDSLRLRNGGTAPIPRMGQSVEVIANIEPQLLRFRRADSTLSMRTIESLYFGRQSAAGDSLFFLQIIPRVDAAIAKEKYSDALSLAHKGLYRNPMHIGLLKRACDLAQHEEDKDLDLYIWQISELFNLIQHTGDGKSAESAWRVMELDDALLYENLWLGTEPAQILSRRVSTHQGQEMLTLKVQPSKGNAQEHYYLIGRKKT